MDETPNSEDPRVRERAYRLWERDGRPDGRHQDHWDQAAREVAEEDAVNGPGAGIPVPDNAALRNQREAARHVGGAASPSDSQEDDRPITPPTG